MPSPNNESIKMLRRRGDKIEFIGLDAVTSCGVEERKKARRCINCMFLGFICKWSLKLTRESHFMKPN